MTGPVRVFVWTLLIGVGAGESPVGGARIAAGSMSAADAVRAAVVQRLGSDVDVSIAATGLVGDGHVFRDARPDPNARLGQPVRFTFITDRGAVLPATVTLTVVGERTVARRAIGRGERLAAEDVDSVRGAIVDVPLKRLPLAAQIVGTRALRPLPAGTTVLSSFVSVRHVIERGDPVTAVAAAGAIEVTATLVAADGGEAGDVIRVVNPDTKRYVRGRIVRKGLVEVIDGR